MDLNFKQAISCYSLIHSVIITLASLTNQCLQAAIDAIVISLIKAGCDYSLRNKNGKSAMDYLRERHPDKVEEVQVSRSPTAVVTHSLI